MPTIVPECLTRMVGFAIHAQLDAFANGDGPAADFARSIFATGPRRIQFQGIGLKEEDKEWKGDGDQEDRAGVELRTTLSQHEPDLSFGHVLAKWPG